MKKKKLMLVTAAAVTAVTIGSTFAYSVAFAGNDGEIKVVDYKAAEVVNKNGYQISKCEGIEAKQWLDENRVIVLKDDRVDNNSDSDIQRSYISIYDLNTKSYTDYNSEDMNFSSLDDISPSGRYVLFGEPRNIPPVESDEWKHAIETEEIFNKKRDILDLSTGEIIKDFDKTMNNYEAQYRWISDDYIFVDYGDYWRVLDKEGNTIKEGKLDFVDCDTNYSWLTDTSEIKAEGNDIVGSFYYTKYFKGPDKDLGEGIYSTDINTKEEKVIGKYEHSGEFKKQGNVIAMDYFEDNGESQNGVYVNRTFAFRCIDKSGKEIRNLEFPSGRDYMSLTLSKNGEKCAFIECDSFSSKDRNPLNSSIKVMDVKTGEVKEVVNLSNLVNEVDNAEITKGRGNGISNLSWDNAGNSLMFNFTYTSKEDGENHTSTYIVTFDK